MGKGAFGEVYRAIDRVTGATVAVKRLLDREADLAAIERFEREAQILAAAASPHVVRFIASGTDDANRPCIALEWLEGEDLACRQRRAPLSVAASVEAARQAALGLASLHRLGVVHRDVKPSNFYLVGEGRIDVRLIDLGIARIRTDLALTREGVQIGTPSYMSPEQARGDDTVGPGSDIFSLGVVLYEMLARQKPFAGDRSIVVLAKIVLHDPAPLDRVAPHVPRPLVALVARAMEKSSERRFASADEMAEALGSLEGLDDRPPPVLPRGDDAPVTRQLTSSTHISATRERRVVTAVFAGFADAPEPDAAMLRFAAMAERLGAVVHKTLGWRSIAVFGGARTSGDEALRAARLAIDAAAKLEHVELALATGRALSDDRGLTADAIERGAGVRPPRDAIAIDAPTARLVAAHFSVEEQGGGFVLRGELTRAPARAKRTLLGQETPCVGRDRELKTLLALLDECEAEPIARAALLTGPAGSGKSRIRHELLLRIEAREPQPTVLLGRGDSLSAGSPLALVADALRGAFDLVDGESLDVQRGKIVARVERHLIGADADRVACFLGEIVGVPFDAATRPGLAAARRDAELMADKRSDAWEDFLRAECKAAPVVLILEDLHWGDLPTVRYVDHALRRLADQPLFVLALARPDVHAIFPRLWIDREPQEIRVAALTRSACERLVRAVLGDRADEKTVAFVVDRAEGNAFYLEELIRAVAEGQTVLPDTVLGMVQSRLDALGADQRRALRAASVFGQRFYRGGVARLVGLELREAESGRWLDELEGRELVVRASSGAIPGRVEYVFRHALLRDAAYAMLPDEERAVAHRLAGEWLEEAGEPDPLVLAEHFDRGLEPNKAAAWWHRAAERAFAGNDLATAIARADRGVACGVGGESLAALRALQSEAYRWHGDNATAERCASEALDLFPAGTAPWFRTMGEALVASARLGRIDELEKYVARALTTDAVPGAFSQQVSAIAPACTQLMQAGRRDAADRVWRWISDVELSRLDPGARARVERLRGFRATRLGDVHEAYLRHQQALDASDAVGDERNGSVDRVNVGFAASELGAYAEAYEVLVAVVDRARRYGLAEVEMYAHLNLAHVLWRLGRLAEARAAAARALHDALGQGSPRAAGAARLHVAHVALSEGKPDEAEVEAQRAVDILGVAPGLRAAALAAIARARLARGDALGAVGPAREAVVSLDAGTSEMFEGLVRATLVDTLTAAHDGGAPEALAAAHAAVLRFAGGISDPTARRAFLRDVPEHAHLIELAAAAGLADAP